MVTPVFSTIVASPAPAGRRSSVTPGVVVASGDDPRPEAELDLLATLIDGAH